MKKTFLVLVTLWFTICAAGQSSFIVSKKGKGRPVLLLPGFSTPGTVWDETLKHLKGKNETHVFTYAGFGGVAPIDTPWYASIKRDIISYIQKEKLSRIVIIGHSMGGTLAMDIAAALPKKVRKLVLVDALPSMRELMMPGIPVDQIKYNSPYNNQILKMDSTAFGKMAKMMAEGMTSDKEKAETIKKWIIETERKTYVYGFTDLLKLDLRDDLRKIKAQSLILGATFPTKEIAKATLEKQYANLRNKQIEMADDSKHFIMFDRPEWFYEQVNRFLKK